MKNRIVFIPGFLVLCSSMLLAQGLDDQFAKMGDLALTKKLIVKGADINARDMNGGTPLMWAASCNQPEIIKFLLKQKGININLKNNNGLTAYLWAKNCRECRAILQKAGVK